MRLSGRYCHTPGVRKWSQNVRYDWRRGGASNEQVQVMLGHSSPQTTSQYIGEGLDLDDHAVDYSDVRVNK